MVELTSDELELLCSLYCDDNKTLSREQVESISIEKRFVFADSIVNRANQRQKRIKWSALDELLYDDGKYGYNVTKGTISEFHSYTDACAQFKSSNDGRTLINPYHTHNCICGNKISFPKRYVMIYKDNGYDYPSLCETCRSILYDAITNSMSANLSKLFRRRLYDITRRDLEHCTLSERIIILHNILLKEHRNAKTLTDNINWFFVDSLMWPDASDTENKAITDLRIKYRVIRSMADFRVVGDSFMIFENAISTFHLKNQRSYAIAASGKYRK